MLRSLSRALVMCALCSACGTEEAPVVEAPLVEAPARQPPPRAERPDPSTVVGETVSDLQTQDWMQGTAEVGGTQLVVFWELWCPHCRREVPRLQALHETLGPDGLEVVGLTRLTKGVKAEDALAFAQSEGVSYALGIGSGALARQLKVSGIPAAAVLVDGEVVWRGHPNKLTEADLKGWL